MKSVGILTISKSPVSYGANLQCYALWKYISTIDEIDCKVIDLLRPCHIGYKKPKTNFLIENYKKDKKIKTNFRKFLKMIIKKENLKMKGLYSQINYTKPYNIDDLYNNKLDYFDIIVSGADQIWNFEQPYFVEPYFINFNFLGKKISYASSIGSNKTVNKYANEIKNLLGTYESISVREKDSAECLKNLLNKNIKQCIDPCFLLSVRDWEAISKLGKKSKIEQYIMFYSLNYDDIFTNLIKEVKLNSHYKSILLDYNGSINENCSIMSRVGPETFLSLIKNAKYVYTDSFHCVVFCIIYNINFYVIRDSANEKTFNRLESLLELCNLKSRIIDSDNEDKNFFEFADFSRMENLEQLIDESKKFLKDAL